MSINVQVGSGGINIAVGSGGISLTVGQGGISVTAPGSQGAPGAPGHVTVTEITSADSPYTPSTNGEIIECDTTDGAITIATDLIPSPENWVISVVITKFVHNVVINEPLTTLLFEGDGRTIYNNGTIWKNKTF